MLKRVLIALVLVGVAGCATVSQMTATGGSRSDGVVRLSFEYGMFDKVQIDQASALVTAQQRCATWGYGGAEPFGGITRQCQAMSTYGCTQWFATVEYQCTGAGGAQVASPPPLVAAQVAPAQAAAATSGVHMVRAKTLSGYCLDVPDDYVGTGASSRPAISDAMPRCSTLSGK
jgi:hypothetical protein